MRGTLIKYIFSHGGHWLPLLEDAVPPHIVVAPDSPLLRVPTSTAPNKQRLSPKLLEPASSLVKAPAAQKLSAASLTSIPRSSFLRREFFRRPPQCFHNPATSFDYVLESTAPPSTSVSSPSVPPHSCHSPPGPRSRSPDSHDCSAMWRVAARPATSFLIVAVSLPTASFLLSSTHPTHFRRYRRRNPILVE